MKSKRIIVSVILAILLATAFVSCGTQKNGCKSIKGMSGYR